MILNSLVMISLLKMRVMPCILMNTCTITSCMKFGSVMCDIPYSVQSNMIPEPEQKVVVQPPPESPEVNLLHSLPAQRSYVIDIHVYVKKPFN